MAIGHTSAQMALRDPDIRLMLRVRDDDTAAFGELVERFQHRLVAVMHHLVGSAEEAEDLAQEVFLRVYRTRKKYTPKAKFSTWLFTIANNLALNALRDRKRRPVMPLEVRDSGPLGPRPTETLAPTRADPPTHNLQQQELAEVIRTALDGLNERQRMAIVLNKFEDMNYSDIADVMALTTKAVKSLLSRARSKLREALQGYIYMDGEVPPPEDVEVEGERVTEDADP
ncbi:rna sigma-24 ecf subfamily : RNA polymerase sigma factor OS=Singulisphaera acidiphila (strain ATCC BAA-1392 / DSM 18658 / VKM B-2454 / MOB10) GN=Sinac_3777 PE=3 SV=1: Sigma70_r2: Sigma70_r4_2 [Gemmata massiliana]|uniref:RNA polymerase sigma factor n=1 Tax=Gemmata massiliana TaxID=1210884 RepID=A0A6P2D168_9BACT|nr:sigma-70 family RNA polymerase sigma factor [Gemmata massiliana]VTR94587.1 rna sigma-24 ecf subfamily : RNA polymerase sigma factor OS=Singulisphaera acidiphila (strain ATCC BAA-1392 / DSM 18658 / VKM B-2454 / MOB10) GN=Sinac_3777 PE=3 SV=1: Sigma70_r2: Sigma70_r4_2 [Gemmata massiliana]